MRVLRPDDPQYRDRRGLNRPPGGPDNRETPEGKRRLLPERRLCYLGLAPVSSHPCSRCGVIDLPQSFPGQLDIYQPNFYSDDQKQDRIKIDFHDFLLPEKFSSRALLYHVVSLN